MIRAVYKTVTWYSPNAEDMKKCASCRDGWAFYLSEPLGVFVHEPNERTKVTICRSVNSAESIGYRTRMLAEAA